MSREQMIDQAVTTALEVVENIKPDQLDAPTPCAEFDVRKLVNHLLFWGPSLAGAGRKQQVAPVAESESEVDLAAGDWAADLTAYFRTVASAWGEPSSWTGMTSVGSPEEMPAEVIGAMVVSEVVVHTWDLARATGQTPTWDAGLLAFVHTDLAATAPMGRDMGLYGPEVPVPADAPLVDRIVGLTGRTP
ncbi:uncharacterized protein (TIGR03086 family) [Saccharothrix ecbatanensis]|uniref:Uncharacterized protein (TIGR03086 family) n=1 Tax=Saccharothrix ecbatanensis TaxID=1105145 RepID=A0A7W9HPZ2_9PSEU|nr:TIGR03086 family metal-binding protein [Saccharothrix ecbatanensis]MBB5806269.1 uncharacterized protein (TIGR03086 family) [Saccharothrix ecbatanensis]